MCGGKGGDQQQVAKAKSVGTFLIVRLPELWVKEQCQPFEAHVKIRIQEMRIGTPCLC